MACSARCRRSRSPKEACRCSCGGELHGSEVSGGGGGPVGPGGAGGSGSEGQRRVNMGITPYQTPPEGPDDPRYGQLEHLEGYYEEERYKEFERDLRGEAQARGMRVAEVRRVAGVWEGEFEPAVSVELEGDVERAPELGKVLGSRYRQYGVVQFEYDENGRDALYSFDGVDDRTAAWRAMSKLGFLGGRFDGERLEIVDFGRGQEEAAIDLAVRIGASLRATFGAGTLLEKGGDYR